MYEPVKDFNTMYTNKTIAYENNILLKKWNSTSKNFHPMHTRNPLNSIAGYIQYYRSISKFVAP